MRCAFVDAIHFLNHFFQFRLAFCTPALNPFLDPSFLPLVNAQPHSKSAAPIATTASIKSSSVPMIRRYCPFMGKSAAIPLVAFSRSAHSWIDTFVFRNDECRPKAA